MLADFVNLIEHSPDSCFLPPQAKLTGASLSARVVSSLCKKPVSMFSQMSNYFFKLAAAAVTKITLGLPILPHLFPPWVHVLPHLWFDTLSFQCFLFFMCAPVSSPPPSPLPPSFLWFCTFSCLLYVCHPPFNCLFLLLHTFCVSFIPSFLLFLISSFLPCFLPFVLPFLFYFSPRVLFAHHWWLLCCSVCSYCYLPSIFQSVFSWLVHQIKMPRRKVRNSRRVVPKGLKTALKTLLSSSATPRWLTKISFTSNEFSNIKKLVHSFKSCWTQLSSKAHA